MSQVRHVAGNLLNLAKSTQTPVFLIGHVTKDGSIAGPKALEHIVDSVLYFEGEGHQNHRIVRAIKNRFGAANEVGIFEMTSRGLAARQKPVSSVLEGTEGGLPGKRRHVRNGRDPADPCGSPGTGNRQPVLHGPSDCHGSGLQPDLGLGSHAREAPGHTHGRLRYLR